MVAEKKWPLKVYARLLCTSSFHKTTILQMALQIAFLYKGMIAQVAVERSKPSVLSNMSFYVKQFSVSSVAVNTL